MKHLARGFCALSFCAMSGAFNASYGHAVVTTPVLPLHHLARPFIPPRATPVFSANKNLVALLTRQGLLKSRVSLTSFNNQTLTGPGSLATKNFNRLLHTVVENGVANGKFSVPTTLPNGGAIASGTIQGDLYLSAGNGLYRNLGEFSGNIGNIVASNTNNYESYYYSANFINPNIQNNLTFSNQGGSILSNFRLPTGIPPFDGVSGAQRAYRQLFSSVYNQAYSVGRTLGLRTQPFALGPGGGPVSGVFLGTLYRNSMGTPGFYSYPAYPVNGAPLVVFAFGNTPLNNPAAYSYTNGPVSSSIFPTSSFINFANGFSARIINGQVVLPLIAGGTIGQQYGYMSTGIFTLGSNFANNGLSGAGPLTNLSSYLFF